MIFEKITLGNYQSNCYIIGCERTKEAVIVDPGSEFHKINEIIEELKVTPKIVILTHAHGDHIQALNEMISKYNVKVLVHELEADILEDSSKNFSSMMFKEGISVKADVKLKDGEIVELGDLKMKIIHTPGHTPGSISIKIKNIILTGDTLFKGSIGRTDFPGGSFEDIIKSIKEKIFTYDDEIIISPGHNEPSTIGIEKRLNPFIV